MALFFDTEWFDARLKTAHLTRADIANALGLSEGDVADIWKDQRELSARDVSTLAVLLGCSPEDVAARAGISTPIPKTEPKLSDFAARLDRVEAEVAQLKIKLAQRP